MYRFTSISLLIIFAVLGYWFSDTTRAQTVAGIFDHLINGSSAINQTAFESKSIQAMNDRRVEVGAPALMADPEIHQALALHAATYSRLSEIDLDPLFAKLQETIPGAEFLSATVLLDPRDEGLVKGLASWSEAANPRYHSLSTLAFRDGLRKGCLAVLARRHPAFDLDAANRDGTTGYRQCPRCGSSHLVTLDRKSQTLILTCPDCQKPYDILAADTVSHYRRANDFLEGFRLPKDVPGNGDEEHLRQLWAAVLGHCRYELDLPGDRQGEAWKLPSETWRTAAGDCEDTSLLLADALISVGIEARVAVGWNVHIGQHAWCVARIGDRQWVLESTLQLRDGELPELRSVAEAAEEYQPEQLFDRERLYFREDGQIRAGCADYWSETLWQGLNPDA